MTKSVKYGCIVVFLHCCFETCCDPDVLLIYIIIQALQGFWGGYWYIKSSDKRNVISVNLVKTTTKSCHVHSLAHDVYALSSDVLSLIRWIIGQKKIVVNWSLHPWVWQAQSKSWRVCTIFINSSKN